MKKNLLNSYVVDHLKSIEMNLSAFVDDKSPLSLHCLRVDFKKIKAAYYFAKNVYKEKYSTAKLQPLFNDAGKIREVQMIINLLSSFPYPPRRIITQLKKKENILIQEFIKNDSFHIKCINDFRKNICLPEKLADKKTIKKFFDKEKGKTIQNKDREDMHRYRIRIKKMLYIYNFLSKVLRKDIELNKVILEKLQQELGDFRDIYSTINFISHEQVPKRSIGYILKLKNEEERQFDRLFTALTNNSK